MDTDKETITWSTLEYEHFERTNDWFWAVGVIAVAIALSSILFKNYLFAVLILLSGGILIYVNSRAPEAFQVTIGKKGIRIRDDLYLYSNLKAFWVEDEGLHPSTRHLLLMTDRVFLPLIAIPIPPTEAERIKGFLIAKEVTEKEMAENSAYKFFERLGL